MIRRSFIAAGLLFATAGASVNAQDSAAVTAPDSASGHYRLTGVQDAAGELLLHADGRFEYALAYGALDEHAQGIWRRQGNNGLALTTVPDPVAPQFILAPRDAPSPDAPTLRVTWPDGNGIAGIDFRIGFDSGEPITGYTQRDGWRLPADETREPVWIDLMEPVHGIVSPRFSIDGAAGGTLNFVLIPNDMGVVDFGGMAVELLPDGITIHRGGGEMRFVRTGRR